LSGMTFRTSANDRKWNERSSEIEALVHRLAYNGDVAAARRFGVKMGRRLRAVGEASSLCSPGNKQSETLRLRPLPDRPF
jgi:hypothetical protein